MMMLDDAIEWCVRAVIGGFVALLFWKHKRAEERDSKLLDKEQVRQLVLDLLEPSKTENKYTQQELDLLERDIRELRAILLRLK